MTPFAAALLDPGLPVPPGLTGPSGRPAGRRFAVYRNNVAVGLRRALEEGFPTVRAILGDDFFAAMVQVFLRAHPPASPRLWEYGADLPAFLADFPPAAHLGYLPDVARLDLAMRHSYHAADSVPLPAAALALPPDRLMAARVTLAPALRLIRSDWPLWSIWQFHHGGPPPQPGGQDVAVFRPAFDPEPACLPPGGGAFLQALAEGGTLAQAIDAAGPGHPLAETLTLLVTRGALAALHEAP
jgi:hypothetical protein